jgi:DNA invertase Pin-like site-specific DNA recombinase
MSDIAYVRVSSYSQNTERQLADVGILFHKKFEEKASAKDASRPTLTACLDYLRDGDTLHVHSLDRLARNMEDLLRIVRELTGRGISVRFHKERLDFMAGEEAGPMQILMMQMLGAIAQFERTLINERRREGMAAAKAAGRQVGAPRKLGREAAAAVAERIEGGEAVAGIARELGVSRTTLYKYLEAAKNA